MVGYAELLNKQNKKWFAQAARIVLNKIVPFFEEEQQIVPPKRMLFNHESSVYALN
ncbi:hypothetical protein ACIQYG_05250 [Peribacillus sp. NPDC096622]|uniref:hypothetical protein n=1 Tax=unclassified Peribacillus TaxID=2675266 RepID=UPI002705421B|nr:hypothetical protein [Peribacillus frigoritolerans]